MHRGKNCIQLMRWMQWIILAVSHTNETLIWPSSPHYNPVNKQFVPKTLLPHLLTKVLPKAITITSRSNILMRLLQIPNLVESLSLSGTCQALTVAYTDPPPCSGCREDPGFGILVKFQTWCGLWTIFPKKKDYAYISGELVGTRTTETKIGIRSSRILTGCWGYGGWWMGGVR